MNFILFTISSTIIEGYHPYLMTDTDKTFSLTALPILVTINSIMDSLTQEATKLSKQSSAPSKKPKSTLPKFFSDKRLLRLVGIALFFMISIPVFALILSGGRSNNSIAPGTNITPSTQLDKVKRTTQPTIATKPSSQTLVYGAWTSQSSVIRAIDIASSQATTVATLPLNIKKVTILSDKTLLYIDQTDKLDHGQRISIYNTQEKQIVKNIPVINEFGIDDYVLSPDKKYLALWEVSFVPGSQVLQGGRSKVVIVDLNRPEVSNLLYDEPITATIPIHYPRAVINSGTVFTDKFIPNDPSGGAGWAYGMSVVDFDGTNKRDIDAMQSGTYSSQPTLSPGGKYLLFAGYDGSQGDGTAVKNGYRQALLTPNTIELLNTQTLQRFKLPNLPNASTYSSVQWDQAGNVIITILSPDTKQIGVYTYDLETLQAKQISIPLANNTLYHYVSQLTPSTTLIGLQSTDSANLGNLGETYAYAFTQLATLDAKNDLTYVSLQDPFIQYIAILPNNYFHSVLGIQTKEQPASKSTVTTAPKTPIDSYDLRRYSFFLKTTLATIRSKAQSNPVSTPSAKTKQETKEKQTVCEQLAKKRCATLNHSSNSKAFKTCMNTEVANGQITNACYH